MKQFDILISNNDSREWVTGIYRNDVNEAITDAIQLLGKGTYEGHNEFNVIKGQWVKT